MLTPGELQDEMVAASRRLQELIDGHAGFVRDEIDAEREAKLAEARAYLDATGTVAERQARVVIACEEVRFRADLAHGLRTSSKLAIDAASSQLSALQSMASALREEARLARTGDGP